MRRGKSEAEIVKLLLEYGQLTLSDISRLTGYSKSWTWKVVQKLSKNNILRIDKRGGVLIISPGNKIHQKLVRVGILRATEYPYIIPFLRYLRNLFVNVELIVYDNAFRLAYDVALGKVHLAMAPAVSHLVTHRISGGLSYIIGGGSGGGAGVVEGKNGVGHSTTMSSSMELCAEMMGLPEPRIYFRSGKDILESVIKGKVKYGVLWEPYLEIAKRKGLKVRRCDLPFCCLLGSNIVLLDYVDKIKKIFALSVKEAKSRLTDPVLTDAYSILVGFPRDLVKESFRSYIFYEEPPTSLLRQYWSIIKEVAFPERVLKEAVI